MSCQHPDDFDHLERGTRAARRLMIFVSWHEAGLMKFPDVNRNIERVRNWVEDHPDCGLDLTDFPEKLSE